MNLPDFGSLPAMFDRTVPGRTLIIDGDGFAYQASSTVKKLSTALTRYQTLIETERFLTGADLVRVHLTPRGCKKCRRADYPTVLPYQGKRSSREKPPLLEPLRQAIQQHDWPDNWAVFSWLDREADDGMVMDSLELGPRGVILSPDKDLRLAPGPYWEIETGQLDVITDRFGWIATKQMASLKIIGHGTKFFWAQMLMGDSVDHVRGIKQYRGALCGPAGAWGALRDVHDESEAANLVLRAYAQIQQDPLAEAQCLWLRRSLEDCAYRYFTELNLDADLRAWLDALHNYHQEVLRLKAAAKDDEDGEVEPITGSRIEAQRDAGNERLPWED